LIHANPEQCSHSRPNRK